MAPLSKPRPVTNCHFLFYFICQKSAGEAANLHWWRNTIGSIVLDNISRRKKSNWAHLIVCKRTLCFQSGDVKGWFSQFRSLLDRPSWSALEERCVYVYKVKHAWQAVLTERRAEITLWCVAAAEPEASSWRVSSQQCFRGWVWEVPFHAIKPPNTDKDMTCFFVTFYVLIILL